MDVRQQMKVVSATETPQQIAVVTTGAKYVFDKSGEKGRILCHQELNQKRLLATIELNHSFAGLSIEHHDETTCVLHQGLGGCAFLRAQINSDSVLDFLYSGVEARLAFSGNFLPDYSAEKAGNLLLIDESGGIGIYPCRGLRSTALGSLTSAQWRGKYVLGEWCRLLVSVFPPRPFDYRRSLEDRIAHHGSIGPMGMPPTWVPPPYPPDEMIEDAREYANILVLHEMIWQGKRTSQGLPITTLDELYEDACFSCFDYVPVDEQELIRVIQKAHSVGMKVLVYMSPFYSVAKGKDFLDRAQSAVDTYGVDGFFFDGISMDVLESYEFVREARARFADKLIYCHATSDPLYSTNIHCPFITTYADFIMRGEHVHDLDDKYVRYVISGFNTSNTINFFMHSADYPLELIRELIDKALAAKARFYLGLPETEREVLLKEEYFPKLDEEYSRALAASQSNSNAGQ